MSDIDQETLHYLTDLCKIHCTSEMEQSLLNDLERILDLVDQLGSVDVSGYPPCDHAIGDLVNVVRDDVESDPLPRDTYLANAPDQIGGMVRIPPVLQKENGKEYA